MKKTLLDLELTRGLDLGRNVNEDERTIDVSISSEFPVERWDGKEILVHDESAIDLSRFPLPLCVSHETYRGLNIGLIENPTIEDGKLRATLRFGERQEASEYWTDVKNGILRNLSVGYRIRKYTRDEEEESYYVTDWMPYEASLVSVPADPTVGVGRSMDFKDSLENLRSAIEDAEDDEKQKILQRVKSLVEEYKTRGGEDHDDTDADDGEPDGPDPMIRESLARQVALKEKQIILEN